MTRKIWTLAIALAVAAMITTAVLWRSAGMQPAAPVPAEEEVSGY